MKTEVCSPTWEATMQIHATVLSNPDTKQEVRDSAYAEIVRCGEILDYAQGKIHQLERSMFKEDMGR